MPTERNPKRTALLIIDFINLFYFDQAAQLAPRAVRAARRTARLKARMKRAGSPVIFVNDNFGRWTSDFVSLTEECLTREGPSKAIAEILGPAHDELVILKPRHSAFYGTPMEFLLQELKVDHLVLTGIAVDMCVFASAQDAHVRQYRVSIPADCTAGFTAQQERSALAHMARTLKADTRAANRKEL